MNATLSKIIIATEVVLFLLPLSLLSLWYLWFWIRLFNYSRSEGFAGTEVALIDPAIMALFGAVGVQIVAWFVVAQFLFGGRAALASISKWLFGVLVFGAIVVVIGAMQNIAYLFEVSLPAFGLESLWDVAFWGVPALIPFTHIAWERRIAQGQGV